MMKTTGKTKPSAKSLIAWSPVSHIINVPANDTEYDELVAVLDYLLDTSDLSEQSPVSAIVDMIGDLIESYENANVPELPSSAARRRPMHQRSSTRIPARSTRIPARI
jgi:hypothetical protein